uniref:Uncharacterized protein n=1 Tax=Anopheles quadriannulatus TaxID=34691 RepID=A0A182XRP3_ANOQN
MRSRIFNVRLSFRLPNPVCNCFAVISVCHTSVLKTRLEKSAT